MVKKKEEAIRLGSVAEDLFIDIFSEVFGAEKTENLFIQYPFVDIYGNNRFIDFAIKNEGQNVALEIDGETWHNPSKVSQDKYYDDLLKQNSMIFDNWKVFRWTYNQLDKDRERVKDQLVTFLGELPMFGQMDDFLPQQKGKAFILKDHQEDALKYLKEMRDKHESIALLYHATGTGKTVTAVSDAKRLGGRTLFLAHRKELIEQAKNTFEHAWSEVASGIYMGSVKEKDTHVVCGSIQSVGANLEEFKCDEFDYLIIDGAVILGLN